MTAMTLGQKIRELRLAKGLTQTDLGAGLVTPSMISQIESDKARPSYAVLEELAKRLETPLEYFLSDVESQLVATTVHRAGQALLAAGKHHKALEAFQTAMGSESQSLNYADLHRDIGECYLQLGQYDVAAAHFADALKLANTRGEPYAVIYALNKLGVVEQKRQKYHSAVHYWRTAYERFGELTESEPFIQSQVLMNLGGMHRELGEYTEALFYFKLAYDMLNQTQDAEKIARAYLNLGLSYQAIKEYTHASEYLQYATAIFESTHNIKTAIETKKRYAMLLGEEGKFEEAIQLLSECATEYKHHGHLLEVASVRDEIAQVYLRQQEPERAKAECTDALEAVAEDSVQATYLMRTLAQAEARLGDMRAAIKQGERALERFQGHRLRVEIAEMYSRLGDYYQAVGEHVKAAECLQLMKQTLNESLRERGIIL